MTQSLIRDKIHLFNAVSKNEWLTNVIWWLIEPVVNVSGFRPRLWNNGHSLLWCSVVHWFQWAVNAVTSQRVALSMVSATMKAAVDAVWAVWSIVASIYDYIHTKAMEERIHALEHVITIHQCVIGLLSAGILVLFTYILMKKVWMGDRKSDCSVAHEGGHRREVPSLDIPVLTYKSWRVLVFINGLVNMEIVVGQLDMGTRSVHWQLKCHLLYMLFQKVRSKNKCLIRWSTGCSC